MKTLKDENELYQNDIIKFSDLTKQEFAKTYLNLRYDVMLLLTLNLIL